MFASILPDLIADARSVTYELDPRLLGLMKRSFPSVSFVSRKDRDSLIGQHFDLTVQAGSLCYAYRTHADAFPRRAYFRADPERIHRWEDLFAQAAGERLRVGISWRGGTVDTRRADRSIDLERLLPLIDGDKRFFVNLQYGDVKDELDTFNERHGANHIHTPFENFNDFDGFAALISSLDLVISVQNTTIHTCGALGASCWGMLPWRAEWRYGAEGDSMLWYRSVRLYRQAARDRWDDVIARTEADLSKFAGKNAE